MYEMDIRVRYSETDQTGRTKLYQILEYFQDSSVFHTMSLGFKIQNTPEENHAWYLLAWDVKITRYPELGEKIKIVTDPYKMRGFYGYRRFFILNEKGDRIVEADSMWIYMDILQMIPVKISADVAEKYIPEKVDDTVKMKRKLSAKGEWKEEESIEISKVYLDTNMHVNNACYVQWAEELLPENKEILRIRTDYRQSAVLNDCIHIFTCRDKQIFRVKYENQKGELVCLIDIFTENKK